MYSIEFQNPNDVIVDKERKSKLLKKNSPLYNECLRKRRILESKYKDILGEQRMDFHIELIKDNPTNDLLVFRAQQLEKILVDTNQYSYTNKSIGIKCPYVDGYGETHITMGYFPNGLPENDFVKLLN